MSEWIEWKGGKRPSWGKEQIIVRYKGGFEWSGVPSDFSWKHYGDDNDIVAYRLSKAKGDKDE